MDKWTSEEAIEALKRRVRYEKLRRERDKTKKCRHGKHDAGGECFQHEGCSAHGSVCVSNLLEHDLVFEQEWMRFYLEGQLEKQNNRYKRPIGRRCTGCGMLFCFVCHPNSFCSAEGCHEVRCEKCDHDMSFCEGCEKHHCGYISRFFATPPFIYRCWVGYGCVHTAGCGPALGIEGGGAGDGLDKAQATATAKRKKKRDAEKRRKKRQAARRREEKAAEEEKEKKEEEAAAKMMKKKKAEEEEEEAKKTKRKDESREMEMISPPPSYADSMQDNRTIDEILQPAIATTTSGASSSSSSSSSKAPTSLAERLGALEMAALGVPPSIFPLKARLRQLEEAVAGRAGEGSLLSRVEKLERELGMGC